MPKKFTIEQVRNIIKERSGEKLLSEVYINSRSKIDIACNICNDPYNVRLCNYMDGSRCRKCSLEKRKGKRKITKEKIVQLCKEKNMLYLSHYVLTDVLRVRYKCNKCNKYFDSAYTTFRSKKECVCSKKGRKITYPFVKSYIEENGDILISPTYIKAKEPLNVKCKQCEKIFITTWDKYQKGVRCTWCNFNKPHTHNYVKSYIKDRGDILVSETYINSKEKLQIKCGRCNHLFNMDFTHYQRGRRCSLCGVASAQKIRRHDQDYIKAKISYFGDTLLDEYYNHKTKMTVKCGACSNIYKITYNDYRRGSRCLCYTMSRGERYITNYLNHRNIEFSAQKKFENCKNCRKLPFDFYVEKYNLLIEFDGIQHFKPVGPFGGGDGFVYTQGNDTIKNNYVLNTSNIFLLRISYNDLYRIEEILDKYLNFPNHEKIEYSSPQIYKCTECHSGSDLRL